MAKVIFFLAKVLAKVHVYMSNFALPARAVQHHTSAVGAHDAAVMYGAGVK